MNAAEILRKIKSLEPEMQKAYLDHVRGVVSDAVIAEVEELVREGNAEAITDYLSLGVMGALIELLRQGFMSGGRGEARSLSVAVIRAALPENTTAQFLPASARPSAIASQSAQALRNHVTGSRRRVEFDMTARGAEISLGAHIEKLRREIQQDQRNSVSTTVGAGLLAGRSPRQIALDLAGRISKETGRRSGGTVGLPGNFAGFVAESRVQLLSGDPVQLRKYLTRTRRDKRFDATVRKAIKERKPIDAELVDRMAGRYADRLLQTHARMIAHTQALESFSAGRDRVYAQLVEKGLPIQAISKSWHTRRDEDVRHSHRDMEGQTRPMGQPFTANSGAQLQYPGDMSLGAGWDETANCRCHARYEIRANYARTNASNLRQSI